MKMNFLKPLIDIILPPRCLGCGKIVETEYSLCADCFQKVSFITKPYCNICGLPFENESEITRHMICPNCLAKKPKTRLNRSAILYNDFAQHLILGFKFSDRTDLRKLFAKWLYLAASDIIKEGVDMIIPVPLSYQRLIKRRYNQAALMAKEFSVFTGIEIDFLNLVKIRHTRPQAILKGNARLKNVKGVYQIKHPHRVKGKRILLIDDVMTTGATLNECTKVLLKAGALSVDTLTLARVKKD